MSLKNKQIDLDIHIEYETKKLEFLSASHKKFNAKQIPITIKGVDFLSVNTFTKGTRVSKNLFSVEHFYVDLDIYNVAEHNKHIIDLHDEINEYGTNYSTILKKQHDYVLNLINQVCHKNNIPTPTTIDFSGRGYNVFWKIESTKNIYSGIHKDLRVPWKLTNDRLIDIFKDLGADSAAGDHSRVFKNGGQLNQKSGLYSETILYNSLNLSYQFRTFTELLLDFTHEETIKYKSKPATNKQLDYINDMSKKLGVEVDENITLFNARKLIPQLKNQQLKLTPTKNINRVLNICNYVLEQGLIQKGNRSNFLWCYSAGCKLQGLSLEDTEVTILKLANSLNFGEKEALYALDQGYNKIRYPYLKTETIYRKLNLEMPRNLKINAKAMNDRNIVVTRTSNKRVNYKALRHIILMNNDISLSARKIAEKYGVGRTKAAELLAYMRDNNARLLERSKVSVNFLTTIKSTSNKVYFVESSFLKPYSNIGSCFCWVDAWLEYSYISIVDDLN